MQHWPVFIADIVFYFKGQADGVSPSIEVFYPAVR